MMRTSTDIGNLASRAERAVTAPCFRAATVRERTPANGPLVAIAFMVAMWSAVPAAAQWHVKGSPHDLSRSGPGPVRAGSEGQVCIFCHTPHNAVPDTPLWNRFSAPRHYRIYESSTTDARIDQPTGPSKLCLSCHDGILAVGLVRSRGRDNPIVTNINTLRRDNGGLGTDLADDHPIGFRYDRALAAADKQLRLPETISPSLPLGVHSEVHCTTCHDPHNNRLGNFLRITDLRGALCTSCHEMDGWHTAAHNLSAAIIPGRSVDPGETLPYATVGDNACINCHKIHSAPQKQRLLRHQAEERNCLNCHSGQVGAYNILSESRKRSSHRTRLTTGVHDAAESAPVIRRHVECVDCHNPHSARGQLAARTIRQGLPNVLPVPPEMSNVTGVSRFGRELDRARFEYEVCLKCHGDTQPSRDVTIDRQVFSGNLRRALRTSNESYHPVMGQGRNPDVPSLKSPYTTASVIGCTDCHDSDNARDRGGSGPNGPHGSLFEPLLAANYTTRDFAVESANAYALCYGCHSRSSILNNESFPLHNLHVVRQNTPCSVCHDAHGVPTSSRGGDHSALINFDTAVVLPSAVGRTIEYIDQGRLAGSCTLTCHSFDHENLSYQR